MPKPVVRVLGAEALRKRLDKIAALGSTGAIRGLDLSAADLLERSANLAPILTGDLIRSGRVIRPGRRKGRITRIVSYGTDHAVFAHEQIRPAGPYGLGPISSIKDATARSSDGPVGGHFLLRPFRMHKARYERFVRDEYAKLLRGGGGGLGRSTG